jgi:uncharacterized phage protein gp47/JayE
MADFPTRLDLFAIARRFLVARARRIDPTQVDVAGSDANLFVGSVSYLGHALIRQLVSRVNALLLEGAEREDLDRYASDRYSRFSRHGAAAARVPVVFSRSSTAGGAGTIPVGTKLQSLTGIEYVTLTAAVFGSGTTTVTVNARAVLAGASYQVGANAIRRFATTPFDTSLMVTNPTAATGGADREADSVFRERIRDFWQAARRGTRAAIEFGARTVPGTESASAREVTLAGIPQRVVELFVADASGAANDALAAEVRTALDEWRACGIYVVIRGSIPQMVPVTLALSFDAAVDTVTVSEQVRAAIVEYVNSLGVGQPLLRNDLGAILTRFRESGLLPTVGSIVAPAGDLYPDSGKTLRTQSADVVLA